jgi:hypothetical protein
MVHQFFCLTAPENLFEQIMFLGITTSQSSFDLLTNQLSHCYFTGFN